MTDITFYGKDVIYGFEVSGHSGFGDKGNDIVCASISSAALMTANTITEVLNIEPDDLTTGDGEMFLKLNYEDAERSQDILKGFRLHMFELGKTYKEFIAVTEKE